MIAVPLELAASPLRDGAVLWAALSRSALVVGGTDKIRTGGAVVFCKVVAVAEAQVRRDGRVRAKGSRVSSLATLGPLEERLRVAGRAGRHRRDRGAGAAGRPVRERGTGKAAGQGVHDPGDRLDDADAGRAARGRDRRAEPGDLALIPWARPWRQASARSAGDWRNALGPVPLEELRDLVLGSAWREHQDAGCPGAVTIGKTAAEGGVARRNAAAGPGHAREQDVLRHRGHQR